MRCIVYEYEVHAHSDTLVLLKRPENNTPPQVSYFPAYLLLSSFLDSRVTQDDLARP